MSNSQTDAMSEPTRYGLHRDGRGNLTGLAPREFGLWVRYEDVATLQAQLAAARGAVDFHTTRAEQAEAKLAEAQRERDSWRRTLEKMTAERDAERAENTALREALAKASEVLLSDRGNWHHSGDEESGHHDEDCRACDYEALLARIEALLAGGSQP